MKALLINGSPHEKGCTYTALRELADSIAACIKLLGAAGHPAVAADDFVPLPCSHPRCFSLAFYRAAGPGQSPGHDGRGGDIIRARGDEGGQFATVEPCQRPVYRRRIEQRLGGIEEVAPGCRG